jgi:hypothetical protein
VSAPVADTVVVQVGNLIDVIDVGYAPAMPTISLLGGDIAGTDADPQVVSTHLASPLPLTQGGTGAGTAAAALAALGGAPLASPALTGTPTAPTAAALTNSTQVATTAYADGAVAAGLTSAGRLNMTAVKTTAYSAAASDYVRADATSGSLTVTLPNAPVAGTTIGVKMTGTSGTNTVTVACAGSDVFNKTGGATTFALSTLNQGAVFQYGAGGIWLITSSDFALSSLDGRYGEKAATTEYAYYVSASAGASDSNDGLSIGTPNATIAGALTALGASSGTIQLGAGNFSISAADGNGNAVSLTSSGTVLRGAGKGLTTITIASGHTVTWGIAALAAQCVVRDLSLVVAGTCTYGAGVTTPVKTTGSAESCYFENIYVTATGSLANAFAVGADTTGSSIDIAETVFVACEARATSTGAGFLLGNATAANILNTTMLGCHAAHGAYGVQALGTGFRWIAGNVGENSSSDFYGTTAPNDVVLIQGVRSENSAALWIEASGAGNNTVVSLRDIIWTTAGSIVSTGAWINHACAGTLTLDSIQCRGSGAVTPVIVANAGSSAYLSIVAENLTTATPLSQLFSWTPAQNVTALVSGYTQASSTGSDPPVATTPGPVRLVGSSQGMVYNGTSRDTAYPVETQTLASPGAVTMTARGAFADILLQANAASSSVTTANMYPGQTLTITWRQDGTGSRTYSWPSICKFIGGVTPTASTAANACDTVSFYYDGTSLNQIGMLPARAQTYNGMFGDGSDGSATLDGTATVAWASKAGSVYTMTRDCLCTSLTVNSGVTLNISGCRIFAQGTVSNAGTIQQPGANAAGAVAGAAGTSTYVAAGGVGGTGATGVGGAGGVFASGGKFGCGTPAAGGTGVSAGGAGGGSGNSAASLRMATTVATGQAFLTTGPRVICGAAGGGAGGGDGTNAGGGGGAGGGIIIIFAWSVVNTGTINASGGNGANGVAGNAGGGAGGGGGVIVAYTLSPWTAGTTNVAGGTSGSGAGTGSAGGISTAGTVLNVIVN